MKPVREKSTPQITPTKYKPLPLAYNITRIGTDVTRPHTIHTNLTSRTHLHRDGDKISDIHPNRIVMAHALLASRNYWTPFIRGLHQSFTKAGMTADLFMVDLRYHNDTSHRIEPAVELGTTNNYMIDIAHDLDTFLRHNVVPEPSDKDKDVNLGLVGHSLGARALLLRDLLHASPNNPLEGGVSDKETGGGTHSAKRLPLVSLDASATDYDHSHFPLIRGMMAAAAMGDSGDDRNTNPMSSKTSIQQFLRTFEDGSIADDTIAFVLNNNLHQPQQPTSTGHSGLQWKSNLGMISSVEHHIHHWPAAIDPALMDHCCDRTDLTNSSAEPTNRWMVHPSHSIHSSSTPTSTSNTTVTSPHHVLFIGGNDSSRLTTPKYLQDTLAFFPGVNIEMIRGGHFAHQGIDMPICAEHVTRHFHNQWNM